MSSQSVNSPSFLSRAKQVSSEKKQPEFLSRGKVVEQQEDSYMSEGEFENEILRNQAQQFSRAGEALLGLPGDLVNFVGGLFGFEPNVPGSEKLREISENVSGGYTKPKNEFEEKAGELMQDISLFALPGAKHYSIARNLGIPALANLAKEGLKYSGAEEKNQALGKVGSMIVLDLIGHRKNLGTAKEFASGLFKEADSLIPKGLSINASNLERSLDKLEGVLKAGGERPSTGDALSKIGEIRNEIKNGKIDLKGLVAYRPSINEIIDKYKGFDIAVKPAIREKIIHNLNNVKGEVIKSAEEYGSKYNPEYLKASQTANEAYSAYAQSNKIANFIEKKAGSKIQSLALKGLLGLSATGAIKGTTALAGLGIGSALTGSSALAYKAFKTILRSKSPTLRKHYFNILEGAAKGNGAQVLSNAKFLDNAFLEMEKTGELEQE